MTELLVTHTNLSVDMCGLGLAQCGQVNFVCSSSGTARQVSFEGEVACAPRQPQGPLPYPYTKF